MSHPFRWVDLEVREGEDDALGFPVDVDGNTADGEAKEGDQKGKQKGPEVLAEGFGENFEEPAERREAMRLFPDLMDLRIGVRHE